MPKLEPRQIQKEIEQGLLWPVYWIHGPERMKSRELLKRIRRAALGAAGAAKGGSESAENPESEDRLELSGLAQMAEERLDGVEADAERILEAAQSLTLGGGLRLIIVTDAHLVKEPDSLAELLSPPGAAASAPGVAKAAPLPREKLSSICVFLAKDLDGRRKFTKTLLERAAVVACEEVAEADREAWIHYLAKRKSLTVPAALVVRWSSLDPWSLDIVDNELEKYSLLSTSGTNPGGAVDPSDLLEPGVDAPGPYGHGSDGFVNAFFHRDLREALRLAGPISAHTDEALPLLGLLAWNARQLALQLGADPRAPKAKLNPYLAEKLGRWGARWKLREVVELQSALAELDFGTKQTPLHPLGLWNSLVSRFCSHS